MDLLADFGSRFQHHHEEVDPSMPQHGKSLPLGCRLSNTDLDTLICSLHGLLVNMYSMSGGRKYGTLCLRLVLRFHRHAACPTFLAALVAHQPTPMQVLDRISD